MMKRLIAVPFLLSMGLSAAAVPSAAQVQQDEGILEGIVRSTEGGMPLAGAMVTVVGTGRGAVTHGDGAFRIAVPDAEQYQLRVDRLGYATTPLEVGHGESATVDLEVAAVPSPDLVVTAVLSPTAANEAIRPSAVFAGEELQRRMAGTVAKTVATVPRRPSSSIRIRSPVRPRMTGWAVPGSMLFTATPWATSSTAASTTPRRFPLPWLGEST